MIKRNHPEMNQYSARVAGYNQGSCKGIRAGGTCRWKSTRGERAEEQLVAAFGRGDEQNGAGVKSGGESRRLPGHCRSG